MNSEGKRDKKKESLRKAMYFDKDAVIEDKSQEKFVRVNVRLSGEVAAYIEEEARRTGNTVSGICGLAITDWADQRRMRDIKQSFDKDIDDRLKQILKEKGII